MSNVVEVATDRREFIKLSTGALVTVTLGRGLEAQASPVAEPGAAVSIGFWQGVPKIARRYRSASAAYLSSAAAVPTGDPAFLRTAAMVSVRGLWRPEELRASPASYALDVMYDQPAGKVPFMAWSYQASARAAIESKQVTFDTPVDALGTLDLVIARGAERHQVRFAVNSTAGALNLRPGFYFIAFREPGDPEIDWSRIRIREGSLPNIVDPAGPGILATSDILMDDDSVPFSYLVLRVEVAGESPAQVRSAGRSAVEVPEEE